MPLETILKTARRAGFVLLALTGGCAVDGSPCWRFGSYATPTIGTIYRGPEDLGKHGTLSEGRGIVYTCKAGHIDLTHSRIVADWTAYFARKTSEHLMKNETDFTFRYDDSLYHVELEYPEKWGGLVKQERENISREISNGIGQYVAYNATTFHEILTWFGYKTTGVFSEFHSAFSWEDSFSNVLGCRVGAKALRDNEHEFNEAVTLALDEELRELDIQLKSVAKQAAENVRGNWYSHDFLCFAVMKKRNFDIGLDDGLVTPWVVPFIPECEEKEVCSYKVPNLDFLFEYGFSMKLRIEPRVLEKERVLGIVYLDKNERKKWIEPERDFALIMKHIKKEAVREYGPDVDIP